MNSSTMNPLSFFSNHIGLLIIAVLIVAVCVLFFVALYKEMAEAEINADRVNVLRDLYQEKAIKLVHAEMSIKDRDKEIEKAKQINRELHDGFKFERNAIEKDRNEWICIAKTNIAENGYLKNYLNDAESANNFLQKCYQSLLNNSLKKQRAYKKNIELLCQ